MTTTTRRLTARQVATALATIDAQITTLTEIGVQFADAFGAGELAGNLPESVLDAWNATHDALRDLRARRDEVEANERPIAQTTTWALIQNNVD